MRVSSALALMAVTLSLRAGAQTASPAAAPAVQPSKSLGPVVSTPPRPAANTAGAMNTYRNDTLHLAYMYPADYTDASAIAGPALEASMNHEEGSGKDLTRCVTLPFSAMNSSHGLAVVLLVRADAGCLKKAFTAAQLPEFTRGEVQGLTASGAKTQFGETVAFTTGGHSAEFLRGTFALPTGQTLYAMATCVLLKPDIACWQFIASSEQNLRTMSAFPVSLEGAPASPLVPEALLAKP